jgi:ribosomal protein S3
MGAVKPIATQARQVRRRRTALAAMLIAPRLAATVRRLPYQRMAKMAMAAAMRMTALLCPSA